MPVCTVFAGRCPVSFTVNNVNNTTQIIYNQGEPEYAVLPWHEYQQLLQAAGYHKAQSVNCEQTQAPIAKRVSNVSELNALREQAGLSVEQLARGVGISPHYLLLIEQGEREASDVVLRSLARILHVDQWNQ